MKFILLMFLGSIAIDMVIKNLIPTEQPKATLQEHAAGTLTADDTSSPREEEPSTYGYISSQAQEAQGGVRIHDVNENKDIEVEVDGGKRQRKKRGAPADMVQVKVLYCTS